MRKLSTLLFAFWFGAAFFFTAIPPAAARDTGLAGGPGGDFREMPCPAGSYLVDVTAIIGAWVSRIAPVCRHWDRGHHSFGNFDPGDDMAGHGGGTAMTVGCLGNTVLSGLTAVATRDGNQPVYVQNIIFNCFDSPMLGHKKLRLTDDTAPSLISDHAASIFLFEENCNLDEAPIGIVVKAGAYVDALGMMCGPAPLPPIRIPRNLVKPAAPPPPAPEGPYKPGMNNDSVLPKGLTPAELALWKSHHKPH